MHLTKHVDVPDALLDDLLDGKVVVFAGAGVSMGTPANLPSFVALTEEIAGIKVADDEKNRLDQLLGDAKRRGIKVNEDAARITGNPMSRPTRLHKALVRLFPSTDNLRIVTTNFDRHFSTEAKRHYGRSTFETYCAPALPLGGSFRGLVYLHGSVEKAPETLVLCDEDFGRAYLTDGWATRFLKDMFSSYTVIFVGYSHDDTVMRYLSRGLPPGTRRYAFTEEWRTESWKDLGIEPIPYPVIEKHGKQDRRRLPEVVDEMTKWTVWGATDHARRIQEIVQAGTLPTPRETEYLRYILRREHYIDVFKQYAADNEWLGWLDSNGFLAPLFGTHTADDLTFGVSRCVAQSFAFQHSEETFALIRRRGHMHPALWSAIASQLFHTSTTDLGTLSRWIVVLLGDPSRVQADPTPLCHLLSRPPASIGADTMLLLFERLSEPYLIFEPSFGTYSQSSAGLRTGNLVDGRIKIAADGHFLRHSYRDFFAAQPDPVAARLLNIVTTHLTRIHTLTQAFSRQGRGFDKASFRRQAIEPHSQNWGLDEPIDILIDIARDTADRFRHSDPEKAKRLILEWASSEVSLIRRLCLHLLRTIDQKHVTASAKIDLIIRKGWLFEVSLRHEVFAVLAFAYPDLSDAGRARLIAKIEKGPSKDRYEPQMRDYTIYNLLVWLQLNVPDCPRITSALAEAQRKNPSFKPREQPDFSHVIGQVTALGQTSPISAAEMHALSPSEVVAYFDNLKPRADDFLDEDRPSALRELSLACQAVPWSIAVGQNLASDQQVGRQDVWAAILEGWKSATIPDDQWPSVLAAIESALPAVGLLAETADLLEATMQNETLPVTVISRADDLCERLFQLYTTQPAPKPEDQYPDWMLEAVNSPAGSIVYCRLYSISRRSQQQRQAEGKASLQSVDKDFVERIIAGTSYADELGRIVIASQVHFLFSLDSLWTVDYVLPLYDWETDKRRAAQAWSGYLAFGRWDRLLLKHLLPLYGKSYAYISTVPVEERDAFAGHMADIAIYGIDNPREHSWLDNFVRKANGDLCDRWTDQLFQRLSGLDEDKLKQQWSSWVGRYLSERISGRPTTLSKNEGAAILRATPGLAAIFDELVREIVRSDAFEIDGYVLYRLEENGLVGSHPLACALLIEHLIRHAPADGYQLGEIESIVKSLRGKVPKSALRRICNRLVELGVGNAHTLLDDQTITATEARRK
jgi:hypothetical protein